MSLMTLEIQPTFPFEDVSDTNAEKLELLLLNKEIVEKSHEEARRVSFLYKVGNAAIESAVRCLFEDARSEAFVQGLKSYEALAALVNPVIDNRVHNDMSVHRSILEVHAELREQPLEIIDVARETLHNLPHVEALVSQNADRFFHGLSDYATTGAALACQLEQNAHNEVYKLQ